ncbi:MAG: hypothetical protein NVV83_09590 [Afipia sp.]|nr:hypothetical protein [Afipia sp.]
MEEKLVFAPRPSEEKLLNIITKEISFPNGRVSRIAISEWHWEMIAFVELWNDHYKREHGMLYEFHKQRPHITDETFSRAIMLLLRDDYNGWLDDTPEGEDPSFDDPRP